MVRERRRSNADDTTGNDQIESELQTMPDMDTDLYDPGELWTAAEGTDDEDDLAAHPQDFVDAMTMGTHFLKTWPILATSPLY